MVGVRILVPITRVFGADAARDALNGVQRECGKIGRIRPYAAAQSLNCLREGRTPILGVPPNYLLCLPCMRQSTAPSFEPSVAQERCEGFCGTNVGARLEVRNDVVQELRHTEVVTDNGEASEFPRCEIPPEATNDDFQRRTVEDLVGRELSALAWSERARAMDQEPGEMPN